MNAQCNQCGGFHNPVSCEACHTLICENCRPTHNQACEQARRLQGQGKGPTVRFTSPLPDVTPQPPQGQPTMLQAEAEEKHLEGTQAANEDLFPPLPAATGAEVGEILTTYAEQQTGSIPDLTEGPSSVPVEGSGENDGLSETQRQTIALNQKAFEAAQGDDKIAL